MKLSQERRYVLLICAALALVTVAVYWPVQQYEFINVDDHSYVLNNQFVTNGLTRQGFVWAFTAMHSENWHPLTWLSLMLDCQLSESNSRACHTTNILFHIGNTLLLFWVLKRTTAAVWESAFVAALFALHPLHVESVAWVSERKDVLSTFFWLLTIWAYVRYTEGRKLPRYLLVLLLFVLGLMAKPMLVTLPFVLLLLDYWPLERLQLTEHDKAQKTFMRLVAEKIPLFALAAISCLITFAAQKSGGSVVSVETIPLKYRLINSVISYGGYLNKMVWPSGLAFYYPFHKLMPLPKLVQAALGLIILSVVLLRWGRQWKYLAVGWLWYLGTMVPVIGLVQVGTAAMADRYTYVPLIGLFIIISWAAADYMKSKNFNKIVTGALATAVILALTVCTWKQIAYWRNSSTLFERTLAATTNNPFAHHNMAVALENKGRLDEAIVHYKMALKSSPNHSEILRRLISALVRNGQAGQATVYYDNTLTEKWDSMTHMNLGLAFQSLGKPDEAIAHYRKALEQEPDYLDAHMNLGVVLGAKGEFDEAITHFRYVLNSAPDDIHAHYNLGYALELQGKFDKAVSCFEKVITIDPSHKGARYRLKTLLTKQDKSSQQNDDISQQKNN